MNAHCYLFLTVAIATNFSVHASSTPDTPNLNRVQSSGTQIAATCFKKSERVSGMNKICTYRCVSGDASITVKAHELCPISIND